MCRTTHQTRWLTKQPEPTNGDKIKKREINGKMVKRVESLLKKRERGSDEQRAKATLQIELKSINKHVLWFISI